MKRILITLIAFFILLVPFTLQSQYQIGRYVIGNGGGTSSNDDYTVSMTIGQPVVGITENDDITALLGFWHTLSQLSSLEIILPGSAWSMISSYIIPQNSQLEEMLTDIESNMLIMKNNAGSLYFPSLGINGIGNWDVVQGYKIYMLEEDVLTIEGLRVNPVTTPVPILEGWNIIAYLRSTPMSIVTCFNDIVDDILLVKDKSGNIYFPDLSINTIGDMNPTEGYSVYALSEATLYYPSNSMPRKPAGKLTPKAKVLLPEVNRTGNNTTVFVYIDESYNGYEIGCYTTTGVLVGSGKINEGICPINIWGDNSATDVIDGAQVHEPISFKLLDASSGEFYDLAVNNIESIIGNEPMNDYYYQENGVHFARAFMPESGDNVEVVLNNSPNPFADITYIQYYLPVTTDISLEIYSMDGRQVFSKKINDQQKGHYSEPFNAEMIPSGMYLIKLYTEYGQYISNMSIVK
jgi:hypothetical protein